MINPARRREFASIVRRTDELAARFGLGLYPIAVAEALGADHPLAAFAQRLADGKAKSGKFWGKFERLDGASQRRVLEALTRQAELMADFAAQKAEEARAAAAASGGPPPAPCPACEAAAQPTPRLYIELVAATPADRLPSEGPPAGRLRYRKQDGS